MKKFIIEKDFWDVFPEAKIGIIVCNNIDNTVKGEDDYLQLLMDAEPHALSHLPNDDFTSNAVIKVWREAFSKFKTKKGTSPYFSFNIALRQYSKSSLRYARKLFTTLMIPNMPTTEKNSVAIIK